MAENIKNKSILGGIGKDIAKDIGGHKIGYGAALLDLGVNTFFELQEGNNFGSAVLKAVPQAALWAMAPGTMTAITMAPLVPAAVKGYVNADINLASKYNTNRRAGTGFTYRDTQQALTMRQASVQAIQGSKMNARNALGGEASLMHRGYNDRMGI